MTEILIHKSADYIVEDRDYYCSDIRDKHKMIQPSEDLVSVTCDSKIFNSIQQMMRFVLSTIRLKKSRFIEYT